MKYMLTINHMNADKTKILAEAIEQITGKPVKAVVEFAGSEAIEHAHIAYESDYNRMPITYPVYDEESIKPFLSKDPNAKIIKL
jgi:hypothetical protein